MSNAAPDSKRNGREQETSWDLTETKVFDVSTPKKPDNTKKTSILPYSIPHKSEADPIVKEFVVERDPLQDKPFSKIIETKDCNHRSVEGYTPRHGEEDEKEVVVTSISDLVEKAGLLPEQDSSSISDAKVVEAKLEFSVLSPEEYEEQERLRLTDHIPDNQPVEVFQGQMDIFSDDEYSDDMDFLSGDRDDDDSEYWSRDDDYMGEMPAPEPRAFMKLWDAISDLITPESYDLVKEWHKSDNGVVDSPNWNSTIDASEIAASRCAGLMALLNLHIHKSLDDLDQPEECVNSAKSRLGDLLRTFNYSRPTAKLNSKMWRAMTCIFIAIVLRLDVAKDVPASLQSVGMTLDEYKYLVHSCVGGLYSDSNA
eukprot:CAMPEP_0178899294 /NCGR_PEP_ID=MMETSP0786-20121207/2815_1 /TAXON_ID=186022 /ORGANISM="Thalassionema frauenfeldii, Strain CCMP 1798" /LENGTH=368 /DNA_ID=CAMNT_0020570125 /DNA_START=284 /DNA_END=1391 /DNA_ORIENTATION=+